MSITMIRHQQIGKNIGVVITSNHALGRGLSDFTATFQIYMQSMDPATGLLVRSEPFSDEAGAIAMFEAWVKEIKLLVELGDA